VQNRYLGFPTASVVDPDPYQDSMRSLDQYRYPDSQSGSGSKRAKMAQKNIKQYIYFFF
jgi:hypothetical protein